MAKLPPLADENMGYAYSHLAPSKPVPRRTKDGIVLSIGGHAFVNWPQLPGAPLSPVPMLDGTGTALYNDLVDGQEVEILSWRPKAREGVTYQVRRCSDRSEWWISATYLRRSANGAPEVKAAEA